MYPKLLLLIITVIFIFPANTFAAEPKAAFIRSDGLWLKTGEHEHRIVQQSGLRYPKWSYDGSQVSYTDNSGKLWVYNTLTKSKELVYHSPITLPQWSPTENTIAFRAYSILNIRDMDNTLSTFQNVAVGAGHYAWTPDGKSFIVSSQADLTPAGWTQVALYSVPKNAGGQHNKVQLLHTLPSESDKFFAIGTSQISFSKIGRWMAFIACPTASYSADTNFLSLLSADGTVFKIAGKMLAKSNWMKWAPSENKLAFIEGEGRLVTENKHLTLYNSDTGMKKAYTPSGLADNDFTWKTPDSIIVSRAKESGWNETQHRRYLVLINLKHNKQKDITSPDAGYSARSPVSLPDGRVAWERSNNQHDVMITGDAAGPHIPWIKNITSSQWTVYGAR